MSRITWIPGVLALGIGLAIAAPGAALAAPLDEIVTDTVPTGTARIVFDVEGAGAGTELAVRWRSDAAFSAVPLAPTAFGLAANLNLIESQNIGVRVRSDAPDMSYAVTFVDDEGVVIGERRHEFVSDAGDGDGDGDGDGGGGGGGAGGGSTDGRPAGDLANTGGELPVGWIVFGVVAIGAGAAVLTIRARRARAEGDQA